MRNDLIRENALNKVINNFAKDERLYLSNIIAFGVAI